MSFRALTPVRKWSGSIAAVRASVRATKRGPSLSLMLSVALLKKMGWEKAGFFSVMIGESESAGRLRVAAAPKGACAEDAFAAGKLPHGAGVRLSLGAVPDLPAGGHAARDCLHQASVDPGEEFVEVTLPVWPGVEPAKARASLPQGKADPALAVAADRKGVLRDTSPRDAPPDEEKPPPPAAAKFTINDTLFTLLLTKAGIAFGVSRQQVLNAGKGGEGDGDAAMDAQCAVLGWLERQGYARAVGMKKFGIDAGAAGDAIEAAAALKKSSPKPFAKFEAVVADAIRDAGLRP